MAKKQEENSLSRSELELLDRCIAWHIRPHREAILDGLASISPVFDFNGYRALELSATGNSMLSPFLALRGAKVTVSCYLESDLTGLNDAIDNYCQKYAISRELFDTKQADVFNLENSKKYDLIVVKDAFGGYNREHNLDDFIRVMDGLLSLLSSGGRVLVIDKGHSFYLTCWILSKWGKAGRNNWHYFSYDEIMKMESKSMAVTNYSSYGVLSVADCGVRPLQNVLDLIDRYVSEKLVGIKKRVVYSVCFKKIDV